MLAHEEAQHTVMFRKFKADFLSIALKQIEAGPRSSGTPFLVLLDIKCTINIRVWTK